MSDWVVDPGTGCRVGVWRSFRGNRGPLIYGDVPFEHDGSCKTRILYAIASRESPLRNPSDPSTVALPLRPALNGVQIYEPWVSAGLVHFTSKSGNLQRMLLDVIKESPDVAEFLAASGIYLTGDDESTLNFYHAGEDADEMEEWTLEEMRTSIFPILLNKALGMAGARDVQVRHAWALIEERDTILKELGWFEPVVEDERLRLLTASLAINASVKLMRRVLKRAKDKTAEALTDARIAVYDEIGSGFGKSRAKWEMETDLVEDGKGVVL